MPKVDVLEFTIPNTHITLVTNDGTALTLKIIEKLQNRGEKVIVLNLPGNPNIISENGIMITEISDQAIKNSISEIHSKYGKIGSFIYLHPHFEFENANFNQHFDQERKLIKAVFLLSKYLQEDLNELGKKQRANFLVTTRMDGFLGAGKRKNTSVIAGGLAGLVKCLNLEWSPVFCRFLDIQPELPPDTIANQIVEELCDANTRIVEVACSIKGRKTTKVNKVKVTEKQKIETSVSNNSVFLVSGGARGITASCVIEMAKNFQSKFILLGRSSADFKIPEYAKNASDEGSLKKLIMNDFKSQGITPSIQQVKSTFSNIIAKKEIMTTIRSIENTGGQVIYIKGDVTKSESFKVGISNATKIFGAITGIIHGAGRLSDKYIQDKTEEDFENVVSVKLEGFLALLNVVDINNLDHLYLFSSVAGFYGNVGQTDYAIANEILNKIAHLFKTRHPKTQVRSINWGAWDTGMVTGALKEEFEAKGISLINNKGGVALMVNEFNNDYAKQPQVIIGSTLPAAVSYLGDLKTTRVKRHLKLDENPFINDHLIKGKPVLPAVTAVAWMAETAEKLYPEYRVFKTENMRLFKGIVFNDNEVEFYTVELKEIEKSVEKIVFDVTITSEGKKMPVIYYKGLVTLIPQNVDLKAEKFVHAVNPKFIPIQGKTLYENGFLFHKKYFQGIEEVIDANETGMTLSCNAIEVPIEDQGQFQIESINTFFMDIQYQGLLVWIQKFRNGIKSLPIKADRTLFYKTVKFSEKLFVNFSIQKESDFEVEATITVYDTEGNVYMRTEGGTATLSKQLEW